MHEEDWKYMTVNGFFQKTFQRLTLPWRCFASVLAPVLGLVIAWAAFAFDDFLGESDSLSWVHGLTVFGVLPAFLLAGAFFSVTAWHTREAWRSLVLLILCLNLVPLMLYFIGLACPLE